MLAEGNFVISELRKMGAQLAPPNHTHSTAYSGGKVDEHCYDPLIKMCPTTPDCGEEDCICILYRGLMKHLSKHTDLRLPSQYLRLWHATSVGV